MYIYIYLFIYLFYLLIRKRKYFEVEKQPDNQIEGSSENIIL